MQSISVCLTSVRLAAQSIFPIKLNLGINEHANIMMQYNTYMNIGTHRKILECRQPEISVRRPANANLGPGMHLCINFPWISVEKWPTLFVPKLDH